MNITNKKVIIAGAFAETYKYEKQHGYGFTQERKSGGAPKREISEEEKAALRLTIRKIVKRRALKLITRLTHANHGKWSDEEGQIAPASFITFTFAENITDTQTANAMFTQFIKRLNFHIFRTKQSVVRYLAVTEFQKRGAIHFHCIFFNLSPALISAERKHRIIADIWRHGFVDARPIASLNIAIHYLTKYLTKHFDDDRLDGKKKYFRSKQLHKPQVIRNEKRAALIIENLSLITPIFVSEFENEFVGKTEYKRYELDAQTIEALKIIT